MTNEECEVIPAKELELPDDSVISQLTSVDIFRLLAKQARRGQFVCFIFSPAAMIGCVVAIFFHNVAWAILGFIGGVCFRVWGILVGRKLVLARRISVEPQLVYWAAPRRPLPQVRRYFEVTLTLYSRTGRSFEVSLSSKQAIIVLAWFKRENPNVRIGNYDGPKPNMNEKSSGPSPV